eukprot:COSAG02_NODE_1483_length_12385_cov_116.196565_3_plen_2312_part_00
MEPGRTAVVFSEAGSLGLKLVENAETGGVHLVGTNAGTQAERHSHVLRPGRMQVSAIGGSSIAGMSYRSVLELIKRSGRPLEIVFVDASPLQSPRQSPRPAQPPEPTGQAAAAALQQHILSKGTNDVKTIDRLRRASLQPDQRAASASAAELMAAAMAEVDDDQDEMIEQRAQEVEATFRDPAALGIKFTPNRHNGEIEILAINEGGQAQQQHPELHAGLILLTVQGESVRGQGYQRALQQIKAAGRPLTLRFKEGGTMHGSARAVLPASPAAVSVLALQQSDEAEVLTAAVTPPPRSSAGRMVDPAELEAALEARSKEERASAAAELERAEERHRRELAEVQKGLAVEKQLKLTLQLELDAQQALITELQAMVDLGPSPRPDHDLAAVQRDLEAEEARAAELAEQLMAEKTRAASEAEKLLQQQSVLQARLEASESASGRDADQSAERHARALSAAEQEREAKEALALELAAQVEELRAQLASTAATHASAMEHRNAELELIKGQLAEEVNLTHTREQTSEGQAAGATPGLTASTAPFCVKCASQKSEGARSDLDSRQAELMRQRTEMLARMEKTRAAERIKAVEAQLVAESRQRAAATADATHAQEKLAATQQLLHGAEGEIEKLKAELQQSDQDLIAQRAQLARVAKESAETQDAAVVGAVAASAAKHAVELSTEQRALHASVEQAKELAEQELRSHQANAERELEMTRTAAAAAANDQALTIRQIQGDLELARTEATRLRAELEESRQAHTDLTSSHEAALRHALAAADGKRQVELTELRSELEAASQQSRTDMAAKIDELHNRRVDEVEAVRSELSLELRTKAAEYAKEIAGIKEELRMAQEVIETETSLRLQTESDKDSLEQLALVDRDHLSHEAAMSVELAYAATEAVADAQRTTEEMAKHHSVEILALRTTSTTEIGELERNHKAEIRRLRLELDTAKTNAEKDKHDTMTTTARELQQMQARNGAEQFEAAEEAARRLEHAQGLHLAAVESARQQAAVKEEQHAAEIKVLRQTTETVRQEVLRLREECQEVRNTSARELAELSNSHEAELEHASATAEARHVLEMSTLTNSMKATMNQSRTKLTTEMEDLRERSNTDLESLRSQLTLEIRTDANEYARKLAALDGELESAKEVIELETRRRQELEMEAVELRKSHSASTEEAIELKTSLSTVTEETASALAEAHNIATEMAKHHQTEMAALRAQSASEIEQLTNVHRLEKQSLQSEITSTKMTCEQELHAMTMQNARHLEEMQAHHSAAEEQTAKQTAEAMEQVKLAHAAALDAAKSSARAATEQHEATLDAIRRDCEAQRLEVVRAHTELQDARGQHAAELEDLQDSNVAAAAGIAAAAAAQQAADMAAYEEMTEATIQQVRDAAAQKIEAASQQAEKEMAALREKLTSQVRSTATTHAEQLEATVQEMREAKAESEVAMQRRIEIEVELERAQARAELKLAQAIAAARIQTNFRVAHAKRSTKDVRVSFLAEHARCMEAAADNEMKLYTRAAEIDTEAKQMSQSMQQAHQKELADAGSSAARELEATAAKHSEQVENLRSEFAAQQAEAESALRTCRDEHVEELQSLKDTHTAAKSKSEEQKAAWLADVQAAMKRSIAAMESASATAAAKHEGEITKMEARVRRAEAEANHFRSAHAQEVEEKNSVATKQQDAVDEHKVLKTALEQAEGRANRHLAEVEDKMAKIAELEEQLEINKSAFKEEKDALVQTHREELARIEATHIETMQASASRLAEVQASNRRSVDAMEAAQVASADNHAAAVQVLQAESAAARRSAEIARITDSVALGGAACTLEIKWRERHAALEAADKVALAEVVRDSETKIADMQRENEAALEVMMHQLRLETVTKVKGLEDSHREELDAMQSTWRAEASLSGLQQSLADAQNRAEKLSEKKRRSARKERGHVANVPRRPGQQPVEGDPWTPKPSDAALIGRQGQDPQGYSGRMEVRIMSHGAKPLGLQGNGTPAKARVMTKSTPGPSPSVTPRQLQAEQKAVQRLSATASGNKSASARPKAKAQSVRRKKASAVSTTRNVGGESLSIRSAKSPGPIRVGRSASANTRAQSRSGQTRGSSLSPRSPVSNSSSKGSPVRTRATTPGARGAGTLTATDQGEDEQVLGVEDTEEEEDEEDYIEELDDEEQQALAELRKRLGNAEAQIAEARHDDSQSADGMSSAFGMEQSSSFSTLEQELERAKADAMDGLASPISPISDESEILASGSDSHLAARMVDDEDLLRDSGNPSPDDDDEGRMAIAWARVRRGEASGYVQASSDTPRLLEKARRATEKKDQQQNI